VNFSSKYAYSGVSHGQRDGTPTAINLSFLGRNRYFFFQAAPIYAHKVEWIPFQNYCYSGNLVAPGIKPMTSVSVSRTTEAVNKNNMLHQISLPTITFLLPKFVSFMITVLALLHGDEYVHNTMFIGQYIYIYIYIYTHTYTHRLQKCQKRWIINNYAY
jgi:hypothetical protein